MSFFFEELSIGDVLELGSFVFSEDIIIQFAEQFDPLPFHLDEEAAKAGPYGGLSATGWLVSAAWMPCMYGTLLEHTKTRIAEGKPIAKLGPSPGLKNIKWLKPVFAGETIAYSFEVIDLRVSSSRPEWGILSMLCKGKNSEDERVMQFESSVFVERATKDA